MIRERTRLESLDREHVALVASRHPASADVARRLADHVPPGGRVLAAASGGRDSTALVAVLLALHRRRDPSLVEPVVGHVDHALRASSAEEAAVVAETAARLGVRSIVRRLAWPSVTTRVTSAAARDARWSMLDAMAAEVGADAILAAHHADDQAETVLMRLARGTGISGLAGIPEVRALPSGRLVLRPLLSRSRRELAELVEAAGLPWIEDPTNADRGRSRERIRHEIIPALDSIHPGAARHLAALAEECAALAPDDRLDEGAASGTGIDRARCREWPMAFIATHLRGIAARAAGRSVQHVGREVWRRAAAMVSDDDTGPRRLRIDASLELIVHRDRARFDTIDPESRDSRHSLDGTPPAPSTPEDSIR